LTSDKDFIVRPPMKLKVVYLQLMMTLLVLLLGSCCCCCCCDVAATKLLLRTTTTTSHISHLLPIFMGPGRKFKCCQQRVVKRGGRHRARFNRGPSKVD